MRIRAEARCDDLALMSSEHRFAVGRLVDVRHGAGWCTGDRVLVRTLAADGDEIETAAGACVRVPEALESADALLIPAVAQALRLWRRVRLELGEAALHTEAGPFGEIVGLLAAWHGATPVVKLTASETNVEGDDCVTPDDSRTAVERIRTMTAAAPGVAAVDLSGAGHAIAVLLEALPRRGRLLLAAPCAEPFTTAFYTDIHRKGVVVTTAGDGGAMFDDAAFWHVEV